MGRVLGDKCHQPSGRDGEHAPGRRIDLMLGAELAGEAVSIAWQYLRRAVTREVRTRVVATRQADCGRAGDPRAVVVRSLDHKSGQGIKHCEPGATGLHIRANGRLSTQSGRATYYLQRMIREKSSLRRNSARDIASP
jgi:hypothetical protein